MNICLYKDRTYKIIKKDKDISRKLKDTKYIIVDIATFMKGPTHTLVKPKFYNETNDKVTLNLSVSYRSPDCPGNDISNFEYSLNADSLNTRYNIYPLMNQMMVFNDFKYEMDVIDTEINIDTIEIYFDNNKTTISVNEDLEDNDISNIFKKLKMITSVISLGGDHIILKNGKWEETTSIPKLFDYILYNTVDSESLYLLDMMQYEILTSITKCTISMYRNFDYELFFDENDMTNPDEDNYLCSQNISQLLDICLYFPQYLELEKLIYDNAMRINIEIETKYKTYELNISEKEYRKEYQLSLFDIINKILSL